MPRTATGAQASRFSSSHPCPAARERKSPARAGESQPRSGLAVVLDDPDNQKNKTTENSDHPGEQGGDAHLDLISDASARVPRFSPHVAGYELLVELVRGGIEPSAFRFRGSDRRARRVNAEDVLSVRDGSNPALYLPIGSQGASHLTYVTNLRQVSAAGRMPALQGTCAAVCGTVSSENATMQRC